MKKLFCLVLTFIVLINIVNAQCKITHLTGTQNYNGIDVTVTSGGDVGTFSTCNGLNGPYWIGKNTLPLPCDAGAYTFSFSTPINEVYINVGSINGGVADSEIVKVYVNNQHYIINSTGENNGCEQSAIISPDGDIVTPNNNWPGSGLKNIKINGPIHTIKIVDSIITGCPDGSVFSLSMCEPVGIDENMEQDKTVTIFPNPVQNILNINVSTGEYDIKVIDIWGKSIITFNTRMNNISNVINIDFSTLNTGVYFLKINNRVYKINKI